jgi:plastocyanin
MRRAVGAIAVVALALAVFAGGRPTDDAHAATTCVKHTKRVVKHVKRHGKWKRVVRVKHHWTCQEVVAPSTPAPASIPPVSSPPTEPPAANPAPEPEPEANAVSVTAGEGPYSYVLSRSTVRTGKLTVQLINAGADPHNMDIQREGEAGLEGEVIEMPMTASKTQSTKTVELQPGHYRMWCTLFHHAEEGMEAHITVGADE